MTYPKHINMWGTEVSHMNFLDFCICCEHTAGGHFDGCRPLTVVYACCEDKVGPLCEHKTNPRWEAFTRDELNELLMGLENRRNRLAERTRLLTTAAHLDNSTGRLNVMIREIRAEKRKRLTR